MQKYSIILPVRNGGNFVKECVGSILSQTLQNFNLIVLDNYSTDGTLSWIESLKDNRIVIYRVERPLSIEENWSRIIHVKKNEFMTLIGHDDILNANYLAEMNDLILKHPEASLYQAHFTYIDKNGLILRFCKPMDEIQRAHEFLAAFMCDTIDSTGTGYMMRSKDYDSLGGIDCFFKNLIFADYALWVDLTLKSYKATSQSVTFQYRIHNSLSKMTGGQQYQEAFEKFLNFIIDRSLAHNKVKKITERYGKIMLMRYCESLSHRLLKTPRDQRQLIVSDFIEKCQKYAEILIPGQKFDPARKFRVNIARMLDNSLIGRNLFLFFRNKFP